MGQIRTYQYMSQEISSLLNKKEQKENEGTVVDIGAKAQKIELPNKKLVGVKPTEKNLESKDSAKVT